MRALTLAAALALAACAGARPRPAPRARVMSGLDVLEAEGFAPLKGKRVGVITNRTGVDARGRSIVDLLASAPGVTLAAVFTPEHGLFAANEADRIGNGTVRASGREIPLISLYGGGAAGMRPKAADLSRLDALVFDIQDAGARFYTYPATMAMALEAAKGAGIEFFVLDRPNPIGGAVVEGPAVDEAGLTGSEPVAYLPVVTRHGMTVGELALLHNAEVRHPRLTVVAMRGWERSLWYDQTGLPWIAPSPNLPDLASATLYSGVSNLEFTNLSVGRGTPAPFGWIGAPWLDADALAKTLNDAGLTGVRFSTQTWTPSKSEYAGRSCPGVRMTVTDRDAARPLSVFAHLVTALRDRHPKEFDLRWSDSRKLIGLAAFKELYDRGAGAAELERRFDADAAAFKTARAPYLLYPDELSVEELAGQVFMIAIDTEIAAAREADVRAGRLGGALLRWDRFTGDEARAMSVQLQEWSKSAPHALPFWLATDHEGGATFTQRRYGLAPFPGNMALGAANSEELARGSAEAMARGLRALGISITFAPDVDVNSNPANPIIGARSFGEDPADVARLGRAAMRGYRDGGLLAVPKHFPGHGDTSDDSHLGLPVSAKTLTELEKTELVPFRAVFDGGARAVMPAHMVFPALGTGPATPVTLSSAAIEGFLRGRMGFQGLVFSDSLDMGAIANVYGSSEAAVLALEAGNDVLLIGKGDYPGAFAAVVAAVKSGRLPRARLEKSVARILAAKRRLGLYDRRAPRPLDEKTLARDRALARRTARRAVTVVRNDGILPLKLTPEDTLGLVVLHTPRYAAEAALFDAELVKRHAKTDMADEYAIDPDTKTIEAVARRLDGAAAIVLGTFQYGGTLPAGQSRLIRRLLEGKAPVVVVSLMNPYDLSASTGAAAAVCAYGMTDSSLEAVSGLLFGEFKPRGRLPVSVPGAARRGAGE